MTTTTDDRLEVRRIYDIKFGPTGQPDVALEPEHPIALRYHPAVADTIKPEGDKAFAEVLRRAVKLEQREFNGNDDRGFDEWTLHEVKLVSDGLVPARPGKGEPRSAILARAKAPQQ